VSSTSPAPSPPNLAAVRAPQVVDLDAISVARSQLTFDLALDPASLVSEAEASAGFARVLVPQVMGVPFLIGAPVSLTVACSAHASPWQPGAVVYPNLETWLRPLTEALSGADRLLVTPSLVGSIRVVTRTAEDGEGLTVTVTYPPDRMLAKTPLRVVSL
jgi:hypothetical protein